MVKISALILYLLYESNNPGEWWMGDIVRFLHFSDFNLCHWNLINRRKNFIKFETHNLRSFHIFCCHRAKGSINGIHLLLVSSPALISHHSVFLVRQRNLLNGEHEHQKEEKSSSVRLWTLNVMIECNEASNVKLKTLPIFSKIAQKNIRNEFHLIE